MQVEILGHSVLAWGGEPEELLETAGRACYAGRPRGDPGKFLKARIRDGHESIIEHASITFDVRGISRACSHQLVRHRLASYSQESQRYVRMDDLDVVVPASVAEDAAAEATFKAALAMAERTYKLLIGLGVPKEDARYVLPNAATTRIIVTMNCRELRHFFTVRCERRAQWEIRALAREMLRLADEVAPSVFEDLTAEYLGEG